MSANTFPAPGYISDTARSTLDIQNSSENFNSGVKELFGAAPEGATLSIVSNIVTPLNNACVFPVDATGGGTINLINVSNIRDGETIYLRCASSPNPITIANLASGSGSNVPIATFSGANVVLNNPAFMIPLKYNAALNLFQEITANWASPGPVGLTTPNSGSFTTLSLTTALSVGNGGTGQTSLTAHGVLIGEGTSSIVSVAPSSTSSYPLVSNGSSANPSFAQLNLATAVIGTLLVANGGTGSTSLTAHGVIVGEGTGALISIGPGTSSYPLVSNGSSADPSFSQLSLITAVTGTLPVGNGGTGTTSFTAHSLLVGEGTSLSTIAPSSTSSYPLVSNGSSADPSFGQLNLASAVSGTLPVANGGTGTTSLTAHGVVIGEGTGGLVAVGPGTSSYPLVSNGSSADPAFAALNLATAVTGSLPVGNGGTGTTSLTAHGVVVGEGTGGLVAVGPGTSSYPLVSNGSLADPAFAALNLATAVSGTLPVANGGTGTTSFTAHGVIVGEAGGALVAVGPGTTGYPLVSNGSSADPAFQALSLAAAVTGTLVVANGGTGKASLAAHGVLVGEGTAAVVAVGPGTSGYPLVSNGSLADPSFAQLNVATAVSGTLPVSNGGTGATSLSAHGVLIGEGTSAVVSVAPSSTSGFPLLSNGSSADPSFAQLNLASGVTGTLPVAHGGTALSSAGTANQVLGVQTSGGALEFKSIVAGTGVTVTPSAGQIQISTSGSASFPLANQCRLYGVTGSPYADTDTSSPPLGAQSLFFGPCPDKGNSVFLYNSSTSSWGRVAASETSASLSSLTAGNTYDVYVYNNSGSVAIEFSAAWNYSNSPPYPTRDIDSQAGVYTKHGDPTRLFVGSIEVYLNTASPTPQLSVASYPGYRGLWNAYNRIQSPVSANDSTATSWAATSSFRIAHNLSDTAYGYAVIRIVTGVQIEAVSLTRYVKAQPVAYTSSASFGIAIDSGSGTPVPLVVGIVFATSYTVAGVVSSSIPYTTTQLGAHVYESVDATSGGANFYSYETIGSSPKIPLSGMSGTTWW